MFAGMSVIHLLILLVIVLGAAAIAAVVIKKIGLKIPAFVVTILWIVFAVVVGVVAIKLIASLL